MATPLLLRCQARSGSTWLMRCLGEVDGIAVALQSPFEVRYAQYMAAAFNVMTGKADLEESSRPNFFHLDKGEHWIGRNPFNRRLSKGYQSYFGNAYREDFRRFFQAKVQGFYEHVAAKNHVRLRYFCEKALYIRNGAWTQSPDELFNLYRQGTRSVYLVRDPRDIFCSNRAFFHADRDVGPEELEAAMTGLGKHADDMVDSFLGNRRESKRIVRYEDLMRNPVEALAGLCHWLELDTTRETLERITASAFRWGGWWHKTSSSAAASIGRWTRELDAPQARFADQRFKRYLQAFGYA